jgi:hypothetical protein
MRFLRAGLILGAAIACFAASVGAVEPKLLPNNTEIILTVNVKQILESEVVKGQQDLVKQVKAGLQSQIPADAHKYLEKIGIDPFKDIDSVTVAHPGSKDPDATVLIIEGAFNAQKFENTAEEAAKDNGEVLKISKVGNVKVYDVSPPGEKRVFLTLLGKSLVITPSKEILNGTLARVAGDEKGKLKKQIGDLLSTTSDKQSLSFVITGPALSRLADNPKIPNGAQVAPVLQALDGVSGAITIAKNINFQFAVGSKDEATTKNMVAQGNAGLLGLRLLVAQKAKENEALMPLVEVMNSLRVSAKGVNTVLTGEVSYENLDKLLKTASQLKLPQ